MSLLIALILIYGGMFLILIFLLIFFVKVLRLFCCYLLVNRKLDSVRKFCSPASTRHAVTAHDGCDDDKNDLSSLEAESKETPPLREGTVRVVSPHLRFCTSVRDGRHFLIIDFVKLPVS